MRKTGLPCWRWFGLPVLASLLVACGQPRSTPPLPETALPAPTPHGKATLTPAPLVHYGDPVLGFAVDYPAGWVVAPPTDGVGSPVEASSVIEFRTDLYGYGHQAFGKYVITVSVGDSEGRSLTETVEHSLSHVVPSAREGVETTCCLTVGGEPALEQLFLSWPMGGRWGTGELVVIHDGRAYWLTFYPLQMLDGITPSDAAARAAFDTFLRTFTFIPVAATATPPRPTVTAVPTPTSTVGHGAGSALPGAEPMCDAGMREHWRWVADVQAFLI